MFDEFKTFIARGNVLDLAVAVIIGAAFGRIVTSLTDDVIMPIIGKISGGLDFSGYFVPLGPIPPGYAGPAGSYADLKKAGVPLLGYGEFLTVCVNFLIVAFVIFMLVRSINRMTERQRKVDAAVAAAPPADPAEVLLLREILAELKQRR